MAAASNGSPSHEHVPSYQDQLNDRFKALEAKVVILGCQGKSIVIVIKAISFKSLNE